MAGGDDGSTTLLVPWRLEVEACALTCFYARVDPPLELTVGPQGSVIRERQYLRHENSGNATGRIDPVIGVEQSAPGVFDRDSLCGEDWLLNHGLAVSQNDIDAQKLELRGITLTNKTRTKDRKAILRSVVSK